MVVSLVLVLEETLVVCFDREWDLLLSALLCSVYYFLQFLCLQEMQRYSNCEALHESVIWWDCAVLRALTPVL